MAKVLDFTKMKRPTLSLIMKDEKRTRIEVTLPTEQKIQELVSVSELLEDSAREPGNANTTNEVFNFAADLISFNLAGLQVTGDDLRHKYGLTLDEIIGFFDVYVDFISEVVNSKN